MFGGMPTDSRHPARPWLPRAAGVLCAVALAVAGPTAAASAAVASPHPVGAVPPSPAAQPGTLTTTTTSVPNGHTITFSYSVPAGEVSSTNWVGLYHKGQIPGQVASTTWQYTPNASGTVTFSTSALGGVGSYSAYYLYNNGYTVLAGPVDFTVTPAQLAPAPVFQRVITGHGAAALAQPYGVALGRSGDIWVADTAHNRIEEFSPAGTPVTAFGGSGAGALSHPEALAIDAQGNVWVADTGGNRIEEFSPSGHLLTSFGQPGSGNGQFSAPTALALAPTGDVYVADQGNNRVQEFSPSGGYLAAFTVPTPAGVALDAAGNIWVSSPSYANGNTVEEFSAAGQQLKSFGTTQSGYGALGNTGGIAAGPDGRIYVAQPDYGWVTVFSPDGTFSTEFGLQSGPGRGGRNLEFPQGLAISPAGHVFVADSGSNRITEFAPAPAAARTPALAPPPSRAGWLPGIGGALAVLLLAGIGFVAAGADGPPQRNLLSRTVPPRLPHATPARSRR